MYKVSIAAMVVMELIFRLYGENVQDSGRPEPEQPCRNGGSQNIWNGDKGVSVLQRNMEIGRGQANKNNLETLIQDSFITLKAGEILPQHLAQQIHDTANALQLPGQNCDETFKNMKKQFYEVLDNESAVDAAHLQKLRRQLQAKSSQLSEMYHNWTVKESEARDNVVNCRKLLVTWDAVKNDAVEVQNMTTRQDFEKVAKLRVCPKKEALNARVKAYGNLLKDSDLKPVADICRETLDHWHILFMDESKSLTEHCPELERLQKELKGQIKAINTSVDNRKLHDKNFVTMECHFNHTRNHTNNLSKIKTEADCAKVAVENSTRFEINLNMPNVTLCSDNQTWLRQFGTEQKTDYRCRYWEKRIGNAWMNESEKELFLPNFNNDSYASLCLDLRTTTTTTTTTTITKDDKDDAPK